MSPRSPATGGEAFSPRNGIESRSPGVLSEAASWYAHKVVPMAVGGVANTVACAGGPVPFSDRGTGRAGIDVNRIIDRVTEAGQAQHDRFTASVRANQDRLVGRDVDAIENHPTNVWIDRQKDAPSTTPGLTFETVYVIVNSPRWVVIRRVGRAEVERIEQVT